MTIVACLFRHNVESVLLRSGDTHGVSSALRSIERRQAWGRMDRSVLEGGPQEVRFRIKEVYSMNGNGNNGADGAPPNHHRPRSVGHPLAGPTGLSHAQGVCSH